MDSTLSLRMSPLQGFTANLVRNSVISATEIVTYDVTKQALLHKAGMEEGLAAHFTAAMTAGEGG